MLWPTGLFGVSPNKGRPSSGRWKPGLAPGFLGFAVAGPVISANLDFPGRGLDGGGFRRRRLGGQTGRLDNHFAATSRGFHQLQILFTAFPALPRFITGGAFTDLGSQIGGDVIAQGRQVGPA